MSRISMQVTQGGQQQASKKLSNTRQRPAGEWQQYRSINIRKFTTAITRQGAPALHEVGGSFWRSLSSWEVQRAHQIKTSSELPRSICRHMVG